MRKKVRNIIGISIIILTLAFLISSSIFKSYKYYFTVDEALSKVQKLLDKGIKVAGSVKKDSIVLKRAQSGCEFVLTGKSGEIDVDYDGQIPDTFRDGVPVVVEGKFLSDLSFKAVSILTKCASRYEEKLKK